MAFTATVVEELGESAQPEVKILIPPEAGITLGAPGTPLQAEVIAGPTGITLLFISLAPQSPPP